MLERPPFSFVFGGQQEEALRATLQQLLAGRLGPRRAGTSHTLGASCFLCAPSALTLVRTSGVCDGCGTPRLLLKLLLFKSC